MDTHFISGEFLTDCLPRDKQYLYNHFRTPIQRQFVCYMHVFGEWKYFAAHTGLVCTKRNLQILRRKLQRVEDAHRIAKQAMDLEAVERIEKGKYTPR